MGSGVLFSSHGNDRVWVFFASEHAMAPDGGNVRLHGKKLRYGDMCVSAGKRIRKRGVIIELLFLLINITIQTRIYTSIWKTLDLGSHQLINTVARPLLQVQTCENDAITSCLKAG